MNRQTIDVERVVREVLAELGAAPRSAAAPPPVPANGGLVLAGRVVTMSELAGRLDGVRTVVVAPGAVVTPAVRDELRRRGVALAFAPAAAQSAGRVAMASVPAGSEVSALPASLTAEGFAVEHRAENCLIAATDWLAAELGRGDTVGVLLTPHAAAALCLANRQRGVRAVGHAGAAAEVGANLLVVDPAAGGGALVKRSITEFCRGGPRPCPAVFRDRLG